MPEGWPVYCREITAVRSSVYFHIDEVSRDAVVAANLRQVMMAHGVEVVYGNRAYSRVLGLAHNFSAFDLFIFPSLDRFRTYCPRPEEIATPVIILPAESVGGTARNVDRLIAKYFGSFPEECWPWTKKVAAFCVWGPSHSKAFEAKGPHLLPKYHVVGHPRFDRRCRARSVESLPSEKIRIGIISRFSALNSFDQRGMLRNIYDGRKIPGREHPLYRMSADLDVEDRIYTEAVDLRHIFQLIDRLDPEKYEVVVRVHPREDRTMWKRLLEFRKLPVDLAPWDQPFMHWVQDIDYVVGPVSTSFYDCIIAGKRPICTIDLKPHRQDHVLAGGDDENPILNYVMRPRSMDELIELISAKPTINGLDISDGLLDILRLEANHPDCARSLDRLARVCLDLLGATCVERRAKWAMRLKYEAMAVAYQALKRRRPEQSSTFVLNRKRRRWIDSLSFQNHRMGPS